MGSLYEKARKMKERNPVDKQNPDPDLSSIRSADISFDEQIEIIGQINEVLDKNRIEIKDETFSFTPKKRGTLIPLLINGGALLVLLASTLLLLAFFNREQRIMTTESAEVLTAEAKIIAALKEETQEQLNEKDRQIAEVQKRLNELREQAQMLQLESEAEIARREEELRVALTEELEAEKLKLQNAGLSRAAIENQLRSLEQKLEAENQSQLAAFRKQSEAALAEKEDELAALAEQYNESLRQFQEEKESLRQQLSSREAELQAQLERQTAQAESEQAEIADELARLEALRRQEHLVSEQIMASYTGVEQALGAGRYDEAQQGLETLEDYLSQASIVGLPAITERLPVERFHLASLRDLIEARQTPVLASVEKETPPAPIPDQGATEAVEQLQRELDQAEASLSRQTGELNRAKATIGEQSREISSLRGTISEQNQQISRYQASQRQIETLRREVGNLRQRYQALSGLGAAAEVSQQKVLALVDTKLQVREVLSSQAVKSEYPDLYDSMEEYFDTYGKVQVQSGRQSTLKDAIAVLDDLLGSGSSADLSAMKSSYSTSDGDLFARFLEKLEALLK